MTNCCICMRSFENVEILKVHEQTQHQPPFRCRFCNSFFTILKFYKNHIQMHRQEYSRVPDQYNHSHYGKQSKKATFKKHFYTPPTAHAVQNNFNSNHGLLAQHQQQQQQHYGNSQTPLKCKYCNKVFGKISVLRKHEMLHKYCTNDYKFPPKVDVEVMDTSHTPLLTNKSSNSSASALTLTPSLLSNLNKLAHLKSNECTDGSKKPAILININTNDTNAHNNESAAKKSQEMPLNSNSGLMISSVRTIEQNNFEIMEKQRQQANNATVVIQGGKKAVSLADLQCPICKKIVSQPFSLKVHLRTHTLEK
jgi:Zinc finger, C2H2 type